MNFQIFQALPAITEAFPNVEIANKHSCKEMIYS